MNVVSQCYFYSNCYVSVLYSLRYFGEVTAGSGSLREMVPHAKNLFYIRKMLKQQHLIVSQVSSTLLALVSSCFFAVCFVFIL